MKLTPEDTKALDGVVKFAPKRQMLNIILWDIFKPKKMEAFMQGIRNGMSWKFAYERGKKQKS